MHDSLHFHFSEDAAHDSSVQTNHNSNSRSASQDSLEQIRCEDDELQKLADLVESVSVKESSVETKDSSALSDLLDGSSPQMHSTPNRKRNPSGLSNTSSASQSSASHQVTSDSIQLQNLNKDCFKFTSLNDTVKCGESSTRVALGREKWCEHL